MPADILIGTISDRLTGREAAGLSVEIRFDDRVVGRAVAPTDAAGIFRIEADEGELARLLADHPAGVTVAILGDGGTELAIVPVTVATPPTGEPIELELSVDLPDRGAQPIRLDDLRPVLNRPPQALFNLLRERGIETLDDIRAAPVRISAMEGLTEPQRRAAQILEAHARLDVVSPNPAVNAKLVSAGISGVTDLARAEPAALADRAGLDVADVRELKDRALAKRWIIDLDLAGALIMDAPVNRAYAFSRTPEEHWSKELFSAAPPDPETCRSCTGCASALSPAAYLVDLIDFLIDNFKQQVVQIASTVTPKGFANLKAVEERFYRPLGALVVDCEKGEEPVRQIEIAIEILEQWVARKAGKTREDIYAAFPFQPSAKPRFPKPDILSRMFDAYLAEIGIGRADFDNAITEAYPASSSTQPNPTKLSALAAQLGLKDADLKQKLGLKANWEPHIKALDWLPELVQTAKTKGLDTDDVTQVGAHQDALAHAEAAIGRVKDYALADIRANLVSYAIYPLLGGQPRPPAPGEPPIISARQLGDYLHIDLETDSCARTTRLASAIEALQSWVDAFRMGREDPGYYLTFAGGLPEGSFDERWSWLRSYSTWGAAQSVLLCPEIFLIPNARRDKSVAFEAFLEKLEETGGDDELVRREVANYRDAVIAAFTQPLTDVLRSHPISHSGAGLRDFASHQKAKYNENRLQPTIWSALDEWYFFVPLAVAEYLNGERAFDRAAAWLHNVYYPFAGRYPTDFPFPPVRLVWPGFERAKDASFAYRNTVEWLRDPFNPYAIAGVRSGAYLRHVIIKYVENLLDWADAEFSRDTGESVARARELYELAETILGADELPAEDICRAAWRDLLAQIAGMHSPDEMRLLLLLLSPLPAMTGRLKRTDIAKASDILAKDEPFTERLKKLNVLIDDVKKRSAPRKTIDDLLQEQKECQVPELVTEDAFNRGGGASFLFWGSDNLLISPEAAIASRTVQKIGCGFCVPPNPVLTTLRYRAEVNLEKIRTCRNIAGMRRSVPIYAPSADPMAIVQARAASEDIEEAVPSEPPPVHRFSYLVERARYYADVARQLEAQLLNAFEREDAERYNLLKAKQDARAAGANISLQDLRVQEANDGVSLAQYQLGRAEQQKKYFQDLLADQGSLAARYEKEAVENILRAHDWAIAATAANTAYATAAAAIQYAVLGGWGAAAMATLAGASALTQGTSNVYSLHSQARSMQASFERRRQEWQFQRELAEWDRRIGEQGFTLANDRVAIANQERAIAQLQAEFAREMIEFLGSKFTNVELWHWMQKMLRRYYRDHLNFATVTARMAQRALEFERQESIPIVAPFYAERERRDLLAAEHLLTDINKLDQHRLTTERRKKELTRTISLAGLDPVGFNALRQGQGMSFGTLMSQFDRDFPGHYLRLIKSVSLTVVALVPPNESIHATLSNNGVSRVMTGPLFDQPRVIQRQPEAIAVTAAQNGTGLFELRFDDPILLPFEGVGVETTWALDLPKGANRFDFGTLADILFTIRYTALEDASYREKVLKQLGMTADRKLRAGGAVSFPLRTAIPDEWFELHHPQFADPSDYGFGPGKVKQPYLMQFELRPGDFPPNEIDHALARLNIAFRQARTVPVPVEVSFQPAGATDEYRLTAVYSWDSAVRSSGPLSEAAFTEHRSGLQTAWNPVTTPMNKLKPFGTWRLRFRNEDATGSLVDSQEVGQNKLKLDWLEDLLFVVAYDANVEYRYAS